jgi:hypothetical protein
MGIMLNHVCNIREAGRTARIAGIFIASFIAVLFSP